MEYDIPSGVSRWEDGSWHYIDARARDRGVWDKFCDMIGYDPYCVAEGLMDSDEEIVLSLDDAEKLGVYTIRVIR